MLPGFFRIPDVVKFLLKCVDLSMSGGVWFGLLHFKYTLVFTLYLFKNLFYL